MFSSLVWSPRRARWWRGWHLWPRWGAPAAMSGYSPSDMRPSGARAGDAHTGTRAAPLAPSSSREPSSEFERFFRAHEPDITSYLWRMTGDAQTANDLSQETFLRAWQRFETIRGYERPGAWLMRVATNLALTHLRRGRGPVGVASALAVDEWMGASDPGHRFAERDLVRETLLELPSKPRAMLVLREVYGLSGQEVAEALGMSPGAVKVALWRARAEFRARYERKGGRL